MNGVTDLKGQKVEKDLTDLQDLILEIQELPENQGILENP